MRCADRYMFEKISERSEALDSMIDEFALDFQNNYGVQELSDPGLISEVCMIFVTTSSS